MRFLYPAVIPIIFSVFLYVFFFSFYSHLQWRYADGWRGEGRIEEIYAIPPKGFFHEPAYSRAARAYVLFSSSSLFHFVGLACARLIFGAEYKIQNILETNKISNICLFRMDGVLSLPSILILNGSHRRFCWGWLDNFHTISYVFLCE